MPSTALRRVRAALIDPRLIVGVLLVAGSTAGVVALIAAADDTVDVYTSPVALVPGDRVREGDLVRVSVQLTGASERYLVPGELTEEGMLVTRPVGAGELIPDSALGTVASARLASVVVSTAGGLASAVVSGASVDLWAARKGEAGEYGTPVVIVPGATVARLLASQSLVTGDEVSAVELLVPQSAVARVLEALANSATISLVPSGAVDREAATTPTPTPTPTAPAER